MYTKPMFNDLLTILANDYRRCLLLALLERDRDRESNDWVPDDIVISDGNYEKQVIELRHCHLPMLAESELIEWDREGNRVAMGPRFDDIEPLLELFLDHDDELPDRWLETPVSVG